MITTVLFVNQNPDNTRQSVYDKLKSLGIAPTKTASLNNGVEIALKDAEETILPIALVVNVADDTISAEYDGASDLMNRQKWPVLK